LLLPPGLALAQQPYRQPVASPYAPGYIISPGCQKPGQVIVPPGAALPSPGVPALPIPATPLPAPPAPAPLGPPPATIPPIPSVNGSAGTPPASLGSPLNAPTTPTETPSLASAAPAGGSGAVQSAAPNMIGDFGIGAAAALRGITATARVPLVTRGAIKVSENESPRPQDRIFFNYNYFNNVTVFGTTFDPLLARRQVPGQTFGPTGTRSFQAFDLHRETFGFERTFIDGDASLGLRLPILQKDGLGGVGIDGIGDLTIVSKYAFVNNRESGDVVSGGMLLTVPSGRNIVLANNDRLDAVLFQPWLGFILNSDRLYFQGFTAVIVSTDDRDVTFYTADLGVGYKAYTATDGDSLVRFLVPTVEVHANIPLENAGVSSGRTIVFPDQVVLTGGVHVGLGRGTTFTVGMAVPVTGPRPYDFELLCQFNLFF
jgi:hypothetical protein